MESKKLSLQELNRIGVEEFKLLKKSGFEVVIDDVRSGQNVGSIFRTADAFAADNIYLTGISPVPPNKEVLKTALGATESVTWLYYAEAPDLIKQLKDSGVKIIVVEQTTESIALQQFTPVAGEKYALIFGNEVEGVSEVYIKNADLCIEIPQVGTKHSLNVSVCAGIVMWHMFDSLKAT